MENRVSDMLDRLGELNDRLSNIDRTKGGPLVDEEGLNDMELTLETLFERDFNMKPQNEDRLEIIMGTIETKLDSIELLLKYYEENNE